MSHLAFSAWSSSDERLRTVGLVKRRVSKAPFESLPQVLSKLASARLSSLIPGEKECSRRDAGH